MTKVLAIDPGYEQSAFIVYDGARVEQHGIESNAVVLSCIRDILKHEGPSATTILEQIESFGMAVGREIFETVFVTGRFYQCAQQFAPVLRMPRKTVKLHLCESARATDSNIRVSLIDRFGGTVAAIGSKKAPGPLYGLKSHEWAALALAVTWTEQQATIRKVG